MVFTLQTPLVPITALSHFIYQIVYEKYIMPTITTIWDI